LAGVITPWNSPLLSGQKVAESAAATVKRVPLELGGKAPVVVFEGADLEAAAKGVREAGFWNGGQECGAACRVLVHESVADKFTELLVREVSESGGVRGDLQHRGGGHHAGQRDRLGAGRLGVDHELFAPAVRSAPA